MTQLTIQAALRCVSCSVRPHLGTWWWSTYVGFALQRYLLPPLCKTLSKGFCPQWEIEHQQWINFSSIIYCPLVFFVKLSILLQYLRIFVPNRKANMPLFVAIQVCIWSCFILYFVSMIFAIVDCTPREKIWNPLITGGHCFNASAAYLATSIINVLTDFTILILPMPSLWKLQMPIRRKILTSAIFATGGL